jgi:hypothetical protein
MSDLDRPEINKSEMNERSSTANYTCLYLRALIEWIRWSVDGRAIFAFLTASH